MAKCMAKRTWQCVKFWTPLSVTFLILWLFFRPDRFHPRVDSGVLSALHLADGNATDHQRQLLYDLAVDLSFRNAHRRLSIRYLDIAATAFYGATKLGPADDALPAPFRQGPKNTTGWQRAPIPDTRRVFAPLEDGYGIISFPAGIKMGKNSSPVGMADECVVGYGYPTVMQTGKNLSSRAGTGMGTGQILTRGDENVLPIPDGYIPLPSLGGIGHGFLPIGTLLIGRLQSLIACKVVHPSFRGTVDVDSSVAAELDREVASGTVHVKVRVALTLVYKVWLARDVYFYKYDCWLWFPPPANATPAVFAAGTQCWAVK
uniref:Late embryogenesis abundant protein LEA-2 subgroup domain-containing protein n=1 Tax=Oryza brachyantha TaxID=4533 RepID=J3M4S8_ORYBR